MPNSLRCKIKHLRHNGTLTERECDRILKALKQEPCEDCISRQAALNAMFSLCDTGETHIPNPYRENPHIDAITDMLERLPSVTPARPKNEWIPVSEELPENGSLVLTTIQVPGREPHVRSGMYFNGLFSNDNGDVWKATDEEVKAWMPLSEPYKAESEVEDGKTNEI